MNNYPFCSRHLLSYNHDCPQRLIEGIKVLQHLVCVRSHLHRGGAGRGVWRAEVWFAGPRSRGPRCYLSAVTTPTLSGVPAVFGHLYWNNPNGEAEAAFPFST